MKLLLFFLLTLLLCLSAKKRHFVRQNTNDCPEGCLECNQETLACTKCAESFILGKNGYCVNTVCPEGRFFNPEWEYCEGCSYGCAKCNSADHCLAQIICPPNCKNCAESTTCSQCNEGFYWNVMNNPNVCEPLLACPPNCKNCAEATTCAECNEGFFLNDQTVCQPQTPRKEIRRKHKNQK